MSLTATLSALRPQLLRLSAAAARSDADLFRTVPAISAWSPSEHLDHLAKVTGSIVQRLAAADAPPLQKGITTLGRVILTLGWIPRGRGRAPERVHGARRNGAELAAAFGDLQTAVEKLDARALQQLRAPIVPHPKFGGLTAAQALRFVVIHNDHHLRIIRDIERRS